MTAWYTASNELIEGKGVEPQAEKSNTIESLRSSRDLPLEAAFSALA